MEFKLHFLTKSADKSLVVSMGEPGLDMLDYIRESYPEIKELPSEDIYIYGGCPIEGSSAALRISEKIARASGLFRGRTVVKVTVEEHAFTKYIKNSLRKDYNEVVIKECFSILGLDFGKPETEERLRRVEVYTVFDWDALLEDWIAAGYPTTWCS